MLTQLIATYGYWALGVIVALEGVGLPLPGETVLIAASIYAGTTHNLEILFIIVTATAGSIVGNIAGFWIGREGGYRLLLYYGHYIRLTEGKIKVGQYLFLRHGGKIIFFARFVAVLRVFAPILAGANRMSWSRFLQFNAAGAVIWATLYGAGSYYLGERIFLLTKYTVVAGTVGAIVIVFAAFVLIRRHETHLQIEAERALPGPLCSP